MQYVCMSEIQTVSDIWSQCFGYDFSDIISDIQNAFQIYYDALSKLVKHDLKPRWEYGPVKIVSRECYNFKCHGLN